jgi:hypothetical protein
MKDTLGRPLPAPKPVSWRTHARVIFLALFGGVLGIVGSVFGEIRSGGFLLLPIVGAPVIEEAFKPIGVYLGLVRWPNALKNRLYVALLCAGAGIVFGLLESTMYVFVYARDHPDWYPYFRYTVPVALHAVASFTVGLGLDRGVVDWVNRGAPLPSRTRRFYIAGVTIHAIYNTTAIILALAGVLDF